MPFSFPTWDQVNELLSEGVEAQIPASASHGIYLIAEGQHNLLSLVVPADFSPADLSHLTEIDISEISYGNRRAILLSPHDSRLNFAFYAFALSATERVVVGGLSTRKAIITAAQQLRDLLQNARRMSRERELGILGEVIFLWRLANATNWERAITAWHISSTAEHDFDLGACDVEVKTTLSERRIHSVTSVNQLKPSKDRRLFIVSVQLTEAADGEDVITLSSLIAQIGDLITPDLEEQFHDRLTRAGYRQILEPLRLRLRGDIQQCEVNSSFPHIDLEAIKPAESRARIQDVQYRINLDGLLRDLNFSELLVITGRDNVS